MLIELGDNASNTDPKAALAIFYEAIKIGENIGYQKGLAKSHNRAGMVYYFTANYVMALEEWRAAETYYDAVGDMKGVANMLSNAGAVFNNQSELDKALDLFLKSLAIAEQIGDKKRVGTVQVNIGSLHMQRKAYDLALDAFLSAIPLFEEIEYTEGLGLAYLNAGVIYGNEEKNEKAMAMLLAALMHLRPTFYLASVLTEIGSVNIQLGNFKLAIAYLDSAYEEATAAGDVREIVHALNFLGMAYEKTGYPDRAIILYEQALALAAEKKIYVSLEMAANHLVRLYTNKKDFRKAFINQQLIQSVKDSIYNTETNKKFNALMFNFELEKKESAIKLLTKEQELQKKEVEKQKGIRNGIAGGLLVVCLFAATIFVQRNKIKAGKKQSDELLLNILPEEVAAELKASGEAEVKLIKQVTVLFTDFKGFTAMSEQLTPKHLVRDLHECFSAFDQICEKYNIEKIKTIGDAYMAAGGLPTANTTHAVDVVKASFEMRDFVAAGKTRKQAAGLPFFEIRIGVHTGPVVAGIVGVKKFQYDI